MILKRGNRLTLYLEAYHQFLCVQFQFVYTITNDFEVGRAQHHSFARRLLRSIDACNVKMPKQTIIVECSIIRVI